jgi:hypothetical protein
MGIMIDVRTRIMPEMSARFFLSTGTPSFFVLWNRGKRQQDGGRRMTESDVLRQSSIRIPLNNIHNAPRYFALLYVVFYTFCYDKAVFGERYPNTGT